MSERPITEAFIESIEDIRRELLDGPPQDETGKLYALIARLTAATAQAIAELEERQR